LPSTRAIETRSLPTSLAATHRGFAFYVAFPKAPFPDRDVFYLAHPVRWVQFPQADTPAATGPVADRFGFGCEVF